MGIRAAAIVLPRFVALVAIVIAALGAAPTTRPSSRPSKLSSQATSNLLLGNPSDATTSVRNKDNFLIIKPFYITSYNSTRGQPNWTSWVVTKDDLGDAPRKRTFDTDTTLPIGFKRITTKEYVNSGFDRGHLCPHSDRAANQEMSYSTFVMTNIMPQAPNLNRRAWEQVEEYGRTLATEGNHVYIIAGPSGTGGIGSNGEAKEIGTRILVPAKCWKILVVVPEAGGDDDLKKIAADTRVIAVHMPNDDTQVTDAWKQYRVSVNTIEKETGLHFFTSLTPDLAEALKEHADEQATPIPFPRHYGE